jgi:hypothetical protein
MNVLYSDICYPTLLAIPLFPPYASRNLVLFYRRRDQTKHSRGNLVLRAFAVLANRRRLAMDAGLGLVRESVQLGCASDSLIQCPVPPSVGVSLLPVRSNLFRNQ